MFMLEDHAIELINAGVDGELGSEETKELDALLESSPEARELHAEMLRLSNFLNALPDQRPPPELTRKILDKIKLPRKPGVFSLHKLFGSVQPMATAAAFAAGLLLSIGFYELGPKNVSNADLNQMVGTIVMNKTDGAGHQLGQVVLEESWIHGSVSLQRKQGLFLLNFDLDSTDPVEIELGLLAANLEFAGIAHEIDHTSSVNEDFRVSGGTLRVANHGRQSFVVFLRDTANKDDGKDINIEFSSGDKRVVKGLPRAS